ncbi:MAG: hypothetical protein AAGA42_21150, partial [Actinomycetota bacterium]
TATVRTERDTLSPRFESGLVDIALTTFDETSRVIDRLNAYPPVDPTPPAEILATYQRPFRLG